MIFGKYVNRYYLKYSWILILGIIALVVVDYMQLEIPVLYGYVINGINNGYVNIDGTEIPFEVDFLLYRICKPMFIVIAALIVGRFAWRVCFFVSSNKVEAGIRSQMFSRCKTLSQDFYSENKVGNMMSLFTNDLETINECFGWGSMMLFDALFLGILSIIRMIQKDVILTLLSMIPMVFLCLAGFAVSFYMQKKWETRQEAFSRLSDFSQESFSGIAVIKAFVKEAKELIAFKKLNEKNENANVSYVKLSVLLEVSVTLFIESVTCIILAYGGYNVYRGQFNPGDLIEFLGYFSSVIWPIMAISQLIEMSSRGKASLKRISDLLDKRPTVTDREGALAPARLNGLIEFKNLTFSYPGREEKVLDGVSFTIYPGENVGIIGKTGSGKTTIVDLILRTYNVPDGTVYLDGTDINKLSVKTIRENAAYVPQDNFLFSDTIANNIAFAFDDIGDRNEAIVRAARISAVHDNISEFKDGYETVLGERGVTVSGGQKQRISIARAVMKDAPILILDDSVSAVDTNTEQIILNALRKERKGKTTVLIAHRVSSIEYMDKIIYVENGKIVAVGTHTELYASCEDYKNMVELQRLEEDKDVL